MSDSQLHHRRPSELSAVAVGLDRRTVQALEYVRGRPVMSIKAREKVIPFTVSKAGFGTKSLKCAWSQFFEFRIAHRPEKRRGVIAA